LLNITDFLDLLTSTTASLQVSARTDSDLTKLATSDRYHQCMAEPSYMERNTQDIRNVSINQHSQGAVGTFNAPVYLGNNRAAFCNELTIFVHALRSKTLHTCQISVIAIDITLFVADNTLVPLRRGSMLLLS
jgi:hypothetical protein